MSKEALSDDLNRLDGLVPFDEGGKEMYERDFLAFGSALALEKDGTKFYIPLNSVLSSKLTKELS